MDYNLKETVNYLEQNKKDLEKQLEWTRKVISMFIELYGPHKITSTGIERIQ